MPQTDWRYVNYRIEDGDGKIIARMERPGETDDEMMLIAAAPALLEALESIESHVSHYDEQQLGIVDKMAKARADIAAARGN